MNDKLKAAYQTMVNETTLALAEALQKKDFALLEPLRVLGCTVFMELAESMVAANIISEEQAVTLYNKFRAMETKMDEEERIFEMDAEDSRDPANDPPVSSGGGGMFFDDMREIPEELW